MEEAASRWCASLLLSPVQCSSLMCLYHASEQERKQTHIISLSHYYLPCFGRRGREEKAGRREVIGGGWWALPCLPLVIDGRRRKRGESLLQPSPPLCHCHAARLLYSKRKSFLRALFAQNCAHKKTPCALKNAHKTPAGSVLLARAPAKITLRQARTRIT